MEPTSGIRDKWWVLLDPNAPWRPVPLTLDRLHEVEARLMDLQWKRYRSEFRQVVERSDGTHSKDLWVRSALHATAEQKIKALAAVIRAEAKRG